MGCTLASVPECLGLGTASMVESYSLYTYIPEDDERGRMGYRIRHCHKLRISNQVTMNMTVSRSNDYKSRNF